MRYKSVFAAATLAVAAITAVPSSAATLTFSGITAGTTSQPTYTEAGYTVTNVNPAGYFYGFPNAGELHFDLGTGNVAYDFTANDGSLFDLGTFDVSYASLGAIGTFTAYNAANVLIGTAVFTANTTGARSINLTGISRLRLIDTGNHFSIDNLQLNATPAVPETATWAMMILGMGAVGYALRRAKRRSDVQFDVKIKRITAGALA